MTRTRKRVTTLETVVEKMDASHRDLKSTVEKNHKEWKAEHKSLSDKVEENHREWKTDHKSLSEKMDKGFDNVREDAKTKFYWLMGTLLAVGICVFGVILAAFFQASQIVK